MTMSFSTPPPKCTSFPDKTNNVASYAVLEFPEPHVLILSLTNPPVNQVSFVHKAELMWGKYHGQEGHRKSCEVVWQWKRVMGDDSYWRQKLSSFLRRCGLERMAWIVSLWGDFIDDRNKRGLSPGGVDFLDGFCGISRRRGLKPIIAAVNGYAFGLAPRNKHWN